MSEERVERQVAAEPMVAAGSEGNLPSAQGRPVGATAARRRRRRGGARNRGRARATAPGVPAEGSDPSSSEAGAEAPSAVRPRAVAPVETAPEPEESGRNGSPRPTAQAEAGATGGASPPARRRRSRGGRGRSRARTGSGTSGNGQVTDTDGEPALEAPARQEADRSEGGVRRDAGNVRPGTEPDAGDSEGEEASTPVPKRRTRRRGGRGRSRPKAGADESSPEGDPGEDAQPKPQAQPKAKPARPAGDEAEDAPSQGTRTRRRPLTRRRREPTPIAPRVADKTMLITQIGDRDQIAVLEERTLVEHYITRSGARSMVGNVYLGKVQNVLPGMEAAFVDLGRGRNAVLYAGEVSYDEEIEGQAPRIESVLKSGQNVMVQVTKDPMGGKGARLTQEISLPGRYLVLVPNSDVFGISRRLPEKERGRLKDILKKLRPAEHGLIVRTAAEGATAEDLAADLERLIAEWQEIAKSAKRGRAPRLMYEEPELTVRVVRDLFTGGEFKEMITDSPELHEKVVAYLKAVAPELVAKVAMYEGKLPLLEAHHVEEQIHKALERKVWLPSGGYIIIDRTEAMTVIDVNTGKHVGKANLEETVTKTNLEAAEEIARQLRLRDIGGMIIIDFIDMLFERNRQKVIDTLNNAMALDKTRSQVFDTISPLGLLEVTRKRVSAGLLESFSETCPTCEGRGILLTHKV
jgi:ribonuclease E